jgi:predicted metal-dependent HD superfamily phosphohydrolase
MAILIDQPRWPAHGTHFAHLASDSSLAELHAFARAAGLHCRAFDHDHYDVPEAKVSDLVAAGAVPTPARELAARLDAAGLRVRGSARAAHRTRVRPRLERAWLGLLPDHPDLGGRLLQRWSEPHRHYHDLRHLAHILDSLAILSEGQPPLEVALAAWFHDAVYAGAAGQDERASADLATTELDAVGASSALVSEVSRLVELTIDHDPDPADVNGVALVDADLSILGQPAGRYQMYVRDVRLEHPDLDELSFSVARSRIVEALLGTETLYRSDLAQRLWLDTARENLASELVHWDSVRTGRVRYW